MHCVVPVGCGRQALNQEERRLARALAQHKHYDDLPEDVKAQLEQLDLGMYGCMLAALPRGLRFGGTR